MRVNALATNATVTDLGGGLYGTVVLTRSTNAAQVLNCTLGPPGCIFRLVIVNSSGGTIVAGAITFSTGFLAGIPSLPSTNLATGKVVMYTFTAVVTGGAASWCPVGAPVQSS